MKIETKFRVGCCVYILNDNKVKEVEVHAIEIWVTTNGVGIAYRLTKDTNNGGNRNYKVMESNVFGTKQELLDSL